MLLRLDGTQHGRLHTVVLNPGILYGAGENILHAWFRMAWEGVPDALPVFGPDGSNFVPTIHVYDMAEIVRRVALDEAHKNNLMLCVDKGNHTQLEIAQTLAKLMGTNKVQPYVDPIPLIPPQTPSTYIPPSSRVVGAKLLEDKPYYLSASAPPIKDMILALETDVPFAGNIVHSFRGMKWHCADFVRGMLKVIREYKRAHNLLPLRIFIHGPPGSGKSRLAKRVSEYYHIPHINVQMVIEYYKNKVCIFISLSVSPLFIHSSFLSFSSLSLYLHLSPSLSSHTLYLYLSIYLSICIYFYLSLPAISSTPTASSR